MKLLIISTPCGDQYQVNADREISRVNHKPSGDWLLAGIESVKSSEFIPLSKIGQWLDSKPQLLYKNGHPRYTVRDIDHGTTRTWGNTIAHGIRYIYFIEGGSK